MKIQKSTKQVALVLGFTMLLSGVSYAASPGSITLTNPGPLNSFSINTAGFNGTSGMIESLTFDLSGTVCGNAGCLAGESLTFGGLNSSSFIYDPFANGTAAVFGAVGSTVFGFNFTGYNSLDLFQFSWDPDVASNGGYGATVSDLAGMVITASVRFFDNSVLTYSGTMGVVGPDVAANLAPVPEPEVYAMMLAGLGLIGFMGYRRKQVTVV